MQRSTSLKGRLLVLALLLVAGGLLVVTRVPAGGAAPDERDDASPDEQALTAPGAATVWFAPFPYGMPAAPFQAGYGSTDFKSLFSIRAKWSTASSRMDVFKFYSQWVLSVSQTELKREVSDLKRRGIAIAMEAPALQWDSTCGNGVEGFDADPVALSLKALARLQRAGAKLKYVAMAEPYSFGVLFNGPGACRWDAETVAIRTGAYANAVRAKAPGVVVGDIESGGYADAADMAAWLATYRAVNGAELPFLHWDADWGAGDWPTTAKSVEAAARARGVRFGMIYYGRSEDSSDAEWLSHTADQMAYYESAAGGRPDDAIFQSWHRYPQRLMPESDPAKFTSVINRYSTTRTEFRGLSVGPLDGSGRRKLSGRLTTTAGQAVSGAPVVISFKPLSGAASYAEYAVTGRVPAGATQGLAGLRLNTECGCDGSGDLTLYAVSYIEGGGANRVPNGDFTAGLAQWGFSGTGIVGLVASDRSAGPALHGNATPGTFAILNSTVFPATSGATFTVRFSASVLPSSSGSGYFMLSFAGNGSETRVKIPIEAPTGTYAATAGDAGSFAITIPGPWAEHFVLTARYGGDARRSIAYGTITR